MSRAHKSKQEIEGRKAGAAARLAKRGGKPLPAPDDPPSAANIPVVPNLAGFLESVAATRGSFAQRRQDGITVTLDISGQPYTWPADDFPAIARTYALAGREDTVHTGGWARRGWFRFLDLLEAGGRR